MTVPPNSTGYARVSRKRCRRTHPEPSKYAVRAPCPEHPGRCEAPPSHEHESHGPPHNGAPRNSQVGATHCRRTGPSTRSRTNLRIGEPLTFCEASASQLPTMATGCARQATPVGATHCRRTAPRTRSRTNLRTGEPHTFCEASASQLPTAVDCRRWTGGRSGGGCGTHRRTPRSPMSSSYCCSPVGRLNGNAGATPSIAMGTNGCLCPFAGGLYCPYMSDTSRSNETAGR